MDENPIPECQEMRCYRNADYMFCDKHYEKVLEEARDSAYDEGYKQGLLEGKGPPF